MLYIILFPIHTVYEQFTSFIFLNINALKYENQCPCIFNWCHLSCFHIIRSVADQPDVTEYWLLPEMSGFGFHQGKESSLLIRSE